MSGKDECYAMGFSSISRKEFSVGYLSTAIRNLKGPLNTWWLSHQPDHNGFGGGLGCFGCLGFSFCDDEGGFGGLGAWGLR